MKNWGQKRELRSTHAWKGVMESFVRVFLLRIARLTNAGNFARIGN